MDNQALLKKAEEFSKRPQIRKRDNQFDKWNEVILYLKNKDISTKEVLNFLFEEDLTFAKKYKGRESTAYALLSKYVKKHFGNSEPKELSSKPQKKEKQDIKKDSELNEDNEDKAKMTAHFGKDFVKTAGIEMAKVVYEMSQK